MRSNASQSQKARSRLARAAVIFTATLLLPVAMARADDYCENLKPTDPVAGTLRKVTIRDSAGELVTNWQIFTTSPVCMTIGDGVYRHEQVIDIEFKKGVDPAQLDAALGQAFGVKGKIVGYRDDRDTADLIVTEAEIYTDINDAGEVRRR